MANLKNTTIDDTGFIRMPSGTTAQRPASPQNGMIRYNTSFNKTEVYQDGGWFKLDASGFTFPPGQQAFTSPGTFTWTAPPSVNAVSVVAVGGGGAGQNNWANPGGAGAGLGWRNNIAVTPGQSYTVQVGSGGSNGTGQPGGNSFFQALGTVAGYGGGGAAGQTGGPNGNGRGGGRVGGGGGAGGNATDWTGGGGAGGYTARGGNVSESGNSVGGGAASGGAAHSSTHGTGAGGGVGLQGQGPPGNGWFTPSVPTGASSGGGGNGGSGGTRGSYGQNPWTGSGQSSNNIQGGTHGGGGGGPGTSWPASSGAGGPGGVRIIWGTATSGGAPLTRAFPSTNTGNL